jgi:LytS/YehU family sensor histidine kinase
VWDKKIIYNTSMLFLIILFGILTGSLLSVLVGLVGARRKIGFGWTFLLSTIFTPIVGLVVALLSDQLPNGERRWGCLGTILAVVVIITLVAVLVAVVGTVWLPDI